LYLVALLAEKYVLVQEKERAILLTIKGGRFYSE